jgi:hypothetical protein
MNACPNMWRENCYDLVEKSYSMRVNLVYVDRRKEEFEWSRIAIGRPAI